MPNTSITKLPFDCIVGDHCENVTNPFSGESRILTAEAVAVFDTIKGAEIIGDYDTLEKGISWFCDNFPEEYMILLD